MSFENITLDSDQEIVADSQVVEGGESFANKLAYFITGLRVDDPKTAERMAEDQRIIRGKYHLPAFGLLKSEPAEYERILRGIAEKEGVKIRSKSDCGSFFEDNPYVGGVFNSGSNTIGTDIDRRDESKYLNGLHVLEHELIHSLQNRYYPGMPIELMEYEAYVAGGNSEFLRENPEAIEMVFDTLIGSSVNFWYRHINENRSVPVIPEWDK